ncbi:MAG: YceI family protein [Alphaproteobacteria bacterium]
MRHLIYASVVLALGTAHAADIKPIAVDVPKGTYTLDPAHASLSFKVNHLGFSNYTARFSHFDAKLTLDPKRPAKASLTATIDPRSLELNAPPAGFLDQLMGNQWFDAAKYPEMKFKSTKVSLTNIDMAEVTGDLTLHGVTHPVTLSVKFNGGYPGMQMDPHARIGFSAEGALKRSDFGMGFGVPAPGTNFGVSDEVSFAIEAEFTGPEWKAPLAPAQ